jgi:hypothetical protein
MLSSHTRCKLDGVGGGGGVGHEGQHLAESARLERQVAGGVDHHFDGFHPHQQHHDDEEEVTSHRRQEQPS